MENGYITTLQYSRSLGGNGVHIYRDHLTWWEAEHPNARCAGGGSCDQTFESFKNNGPHPDEVPDDIAAQVRALIHDIEFGKR